MANGNKIISEKTKPIIDKLTFASKSVFLVGLPGSGKTTILKEYFQNKSSTETIIDCSIKREEYFLIRDNDVYKLYYICLVIRKIINFISNNYHLKMSNHFFHYLYYIDSLINQITIMYRTDIYKSSFAFIDQNLYKYPEILIDKLIVLLNNIDIKNVTLIFDDFDKTGESSERFQNVIFNLKKYFKLIMTISDDKFIDNTKSLDGFDCDVIEVRYNYDLEVVKEILDIESNNILKNNLEYDFNIRIRNVLSDDVIFLLIEKTNGNINAMLYILRLFYSRIHELSKDEYDNYLINYMDSEMNSNPYLVGKYIKKRTLYLK